MHDRLKLSAGRGASEPLRTRAACQRRSPPPSEYALGAEVSHRPAVSAATPSSMYTLDLTRWPQARHVHFRLSNDELRAIFRFIEGWQASGPRATQEIRATAALLQDVGLTAP